MLKKLKLLYNSPSPLSEDILLRGEYYKKLKQKTKFAILCKRWYNYNINAHKMRKNIPKEINKMNRQLEGRELELKVTNMMVELGIPAHLKGYHYVREGIIEAYNDIEVVSSVTKLLYPEIAKKFKTSDQKVERAIRNVIEVTWFKDYVHFREFFGNSTWIRRPTNSEFIASFVEKIKYFS